MKHIITIILSWLASGALASEVLIPKELVGEWRSPRATEPYNGLYIRADGKAEFVAAGDGKFSRGGLGVATYDRSTRTLTLNFPESPRKLFRFVYDSTNGRLTEQSDLRRWPFKRHSERVPDFAANSQ